MLVPNFHQLWDAAVSHYDLAYLGQVIPLG